MKILSVDVGTTAMKMCVFDGRVNGLESLRRYCNQAVSAIKGAYLA